MDVLRKDDGVQQLKAIFSRFDMDSDGSLTQLELAALLRSIGLKPSGDQIHSLLASIDANANGSVEFDELAAAILLSADDRNPSSSSAEAIGAMVDRMRLEEVFRRFDRDGNGYITAAELAGSMAKMGQPLTYRQLLEMIREADTDGDGAISFEEFESIMAGIAVDFLGQPPPPPAAP